MFGAASKFRRAVSVSFWPEADARLAQEGGLCSKAEATQPER